MRIGIDTGGTFTDFILLEGGQIRIRKLLSSPYRPGAPILEAMQRFIEPGRVAEIIYGFTVATNALLERKGAKTAIITTQGFEDIIEIGRQNRPKIYDLQVEKPAPLVPRHLRYGVPERVSAQGEILEPLRIEVAEEKLAGPVPCTPVSWRAIWLSRGSLFLPIQGPCRRWDCCWPTWSKIILRPASSSQMIWIMGNC